MTMPKRRSLWLAAALVLLAAAIGTAAMKKKAPQAAALPTAAQAPAWLELLPSDVARVTLHELRQTLALSGSLKAVSQAVVKARVAGEVREVLVREGEAVRAGQVLVRMDASEYQARFEQAKGALQAARAQLDIASKTRDNNHALLEKNFISKNAFDNAESQYAIAAANLATARGALDVAQKSLQDTVIRAPLAGFISSRTIQPGEKVSPDNHLLEVVDLRQMELEAAVPALDIASIALGQDVQVKVEGMPEALTGTVVRLNPATQAGSRSILAYIRVANPQQTLRGGMFAEARLTLAKKSGVLSVPQAAVRSDGGLPMIYVIENGKLLQKPVTLGMRGEDERGSAVEIVSGLADGTQVVSTNLGNLRSGTPVKLAAATASAATTRAKLD
jgi:membrane fusion protein, multidrug efflux system